MVSDSTSQTTAQHAGLPDRELRGADRAVVVSDDNNTPLSDFTSAIWVKNSLPTKGNAWLNALATQRANQASGEAGASKVRFA